jgi:hypothetical protein
MRYIHILGYQDANLTVHSPPQGLEFSWAQISSRVRKCIYQGRGFAISGLGDLLAGGLCVSSGQVFLIDYSRRTCVSVSHLCWQDQGLTEAVG